MILNFGKHNGKSTELLLLKYPDYVKWVLEKSDANGALLAVKNNFKYLIDRFDKKPLIKKCFLCKEPSTRLSFYIGNTSPMPWCANCDPYSNGAIEGKLIIFNDYLKALNFVQLYCGGTKGGYGEIIKSIASLKGLPNRVGEKQAQSFFAD